MPPEFVALLQRFNALGRLLPQRLDDLEDAHTRAEARIVLAEMKEVRAEIDAFLAAARHQ